MSSRGVAPRHPGRSRRGSCRFPGPGIPPGRLRVSRSRGGLDALCSHVAMGSDPGEAGNSRVARLGCRESSRGNTKRLFRNRAGSIKDHLVCPCPGAQGLLLPRKCAGAKWSSGPSSLSIYSFPLSSSLALILRAGNRRHHDRTWQDRGLGTPRATCSRGPVELSANVLFVAVGFGVLRAGVEGLAFGRRLARREAVRLSSPNNGLGSTGSGFGR